MRKSRANGYCDDCGSTSIYVYEIENHFAECAYCGSYNTETECEFDESKIEEEVSND